MKRVWPIIAVSNVPASAKWYMTLLGAQQNHAGGTTFDQIVDEDGTVTIAGADEQSVKKALGRVEAMTASVQVGRIYEGTVTASFGFGLEAVVVLDADRVR